MAWARIPPDLLERVIKAKGKWGAPVLELEDLLRAECVCKGWSAALRALPVEMRTVVLGRIGWGDTPAAKKLHFAQWAAARAPRVTGEVELELRDIKDKEMTKAVAAALQALLSQEASKPRLVVEYPPPGAFEPYLPTLAACPSQERLKLKLGSDREQEQVLSLVPGKGVSSLGSLRELEVHGETGATLKITLPMPSLEALRVRNIHGDTWNGEDRGASIVVGCCPGSGEPSGAGPPLPALTRMELASPDLRMDAHAVPALQELRLCATGTSWQVVNLRACTQLTFLELGAFTLTVGDLEEGWAVDQSNFLAPALAGAPSSLRRLKLTLAENLDSQMSTALSGPSLTNLTHVELSMNEMSGGPALRFDARLLAGMRHLEEFVLRGGKLLNPAARKKLPALKRWEHLAY